MIRRRVLIRGWSRGRPDGPWPSHLGQSAPHFTFCPQSRVNAPFSDTFGFVKLNVHCSSNASFYTWYDKFSSFLCQICKFYFAQCSIKLNPICHLNADSESQDDILLPQYDPPLSSMQFFHTNSTVKLTCKLKTDHKKQVNTKKQWGGGGLLNTF